MRTNDAVLIVRELPEHGRRYMVACRFKTTSVDICGDHAPRRCESQLGIIALVNHGRDCKGCNTAALWAKLLDVPATDDLARAAEAAVTRLYIYEGRN